jgi:hypothetical protein
MTLWVVAQDHDLAERVELADHHRGRTFRERIGGEGSVDVGDQVEVHTTFDDSWSSGFEIAEVIPEGYRLRRQSDGSLLPGYTSESDVRPLR